MSHFSVTVLRQLTTAGKITITISFHRTLAIAIIIRGVACCIQVANYTHKMPRILWFYTSRHLCNRKSLVKPTRDVLYGK